MFFQCMILIFVLKLRFVFESCIKCLSHLVWYMAQRGAEALLHAVQMRGMGNDFSKVMELIKHSEENLIMDVATFEFQSDDENELPSSSYGIYKLWEQLDVELHNYLITVWQLLGGMKSEPHCSPIAPIHFNNVITNFLRHPKTSLSPQLETDIEWMKPAFHKWILLYVQAGVVLGEKNLWEKLQSAISNTLDECLLPEENIIFSYVAGYGAFWEFVLDLLHARQQNTLAIFLQARLETDFCPSSPSISSSISSPRSTPEG